MLGWRAAATVWKITLYICLVLISLLYPTFVLQELWNWFVVVAFGLQPISYLVMYGLFLILTTFKYILSDKTAFLGGTLRPKPDKNDSKYQVWEDYIEDLTDWQTEKTARRMSQTSVPDESVPLQIIWTLVAKDLLLYTGICTVALVVGFVVHIVAS